jgi:hypothetical protein
LGMLFIPSSTKRRRSRSSCGFQGACGMAICCSVCCAVCCPIYCSMRWSMCWSTCATL